eukprot:comp23182_c1_seq2/m.37571 comp23182_c1_seq2/g.37571  ORF comp23182_c1_seq2/g.37571 comp23182_c1_seq2/m.37571 type:complete len:198 (-) comp23182_c1_seq2:257-850(-)
MLRNGKHRTVLTLPSYMVSVIQYAKPSALKADLNDQFKEKYPEAGITLSKLRSLKQNMLEIALHCDVELAVLALSYIYFERLVLNRHVVKQNRKLVAGVCLLLATKFYNPKVTAHFLNNLLLEIEGEFHLSTKDIKAAEFEFYSKLDFALHPQMKEFMPFFQRVQQAVPDYKHKLMDPVALMCHGPIVTDQSAVRED